MKTLLQISIFIATLFIHSCMGQVHEVESPTQGSSILWEISGNGLAKPSYVFGTMHLIPKDDFFVPKGTEACLKSADALVLEVDIDIAMKDQLELAKKMLIPNNQTIADFMDQEQFANLKSFMIDSLQIGENKFERYMHIKPIFLSALIIQEAMGKVEAYELYFTKLSKKADMQLKPLETIEFQMALLDTIAIEDQVDDYMKTDMIKEYLNMVEVYKTQDLEGLYQVMTDSEGFNEIEMELIIKRNHNWAAILTGWMQEESVFVAVGAGHLPGKQGLLQLLRNLGYTVEPVR